MLRFCPYLAVTNPDEILAELTRPDADGNMVAAVGENVKDAMVKDIRRRMTPQPLKIRADVELTCFAYDGWGRCHFATAPPNCVLIVHLYTLAASSPWPGHLSPESLLATGPLTNC